MKCQKPCGPHLGKLVHQLPEVITFAYDLCFWCMIARWKGIIEEIHFRYNIEGNFIFQTCFPKKTSSRASKQFRKWKLLKIVNYQNCQKTVLSQFEKVGGHRYPPGSTLLSIINCALFLKYLLHVCNYNHNKVGLFYHLFHFQ